MLGFAELYSALSGLVRILAEHPCNVNLLKPRVAFKFAPCYWLHTRTSHVMRNTLACQHSGVEIDHHKGHSLPCVTLLIQLEIIKAPATCRRCYRIGLGRFGASNHDSSIW